MADTETIAFIGLGNMGGPMALNLVKAGHTVRAYDVSDVATGPLKDAGASVHGSPGEAASDAGVVVTMLPNGATVQDVYLAEHGVLENAKPGTLLIDCSTIAAATARSVAEKARDKELDLLDAPVSGGVGGARAGTLTFIVGGPEAALGRARPILEAMGRKVFHAGESGAGQVAKICNNMALAIHMIGSSEALLLGEAHGLDPKVLSEIMTASSGRSWTLEVYNPFPGVMDGVPASNDYQGGFGSALMLKDLGLALEAVEATSSAAPLGTLARQLYQEHAEGGDGGLDFSSILQRLRARRG